MSELTRRLTEDAARLARTACDQMYENPFWMARFGERGRRFSEEDGRFHLQYLLQALEGGDPTPLTSYARWLQGVLTARGMCTRHLEENFQRLSRLISAEGYPDAARATEMLERAVQALRYHHPVASEVQERTAPLAVAAVSALLERHPDWAPKPTSRARCEDDARYHLSYVADSVANGRPEQFTDYVLWVAGFLQRFSVPPAHTRALLETLEQAAARTLSAAARQVVTEHLRAGLQALG